jgi:hypothetical protein
VLTAAILGAPSYGGDSIQQVLEARQKLPDLRAVPAVLRPQLIAMLQPNPADRPQRTPDLLKRWPYPPAPSPAKVVKEPRAGSPEFGKRFWNYRIPLLVLGVGIALALGLGFFLRHTVKPPTAPMVDRIPLPKPAETATESGQPPARSAEPELNSAPPATPELKEIPVTPAPEVTSVGRQPAAPPVEPAPEEPPNTPAAASIGPQPRGTAG